ncbi:MAG: CehA/McbA family metallohydrolase [Chloroflexi bacterium]|nr:CehA/McbA family metallohydrolase [Chloroflexota bacterium]
MPLLEETVARGLELEQGRHPTLTDLREALEFDLDLDGVGRAARDVRLPREEPPSDELLKHYIDTMYRAIASSRLIRVEIADSATTASRPDGAIQLRAGERLWLLVFVDNQTTNPAEFSARVGNTTFAGTAESGRVASVLVDAGEVFVGTHEVSLELECQNWKEAIQVPIEVQPAWRLSVALLDDETDVSTAARVYLNDQLGPAWPEEAKIRRDEHENEFFHADGSFEATVSGDATLVVTRGMEYEPLEVVIPAPSGPGHSETLRLRRWSHMAADGWWSGDVHVHLHYGGEYLLDPEHASLVQRGEDVNFMNMMVANQGSAFVHDQTFFEGRPHELSDSEHILRWGEEYRNDFYGHLCMYGIRDLVPPIYSGFRLSEHAHDLPANVVGADRCHEAGGTLSYAHPLFGTGNLDRVFTHPRTVEAKELPVDVALGKIDALDVMSYPSSDLETSELWYKLLNCGFRLPATAGTDTFMNFAGTGIFSNPPAGNRVFVNVEGDFTTESWCEAIRDGRTFVTNGPMLSLDVNGQGIGARLELEAGQTVDIVGEARSHIPLEQIELVLNGEIVASGEIVEGGKRARLQSSITIESDSWVALRTRGPLHPHVLGGRLFAHTSPVYVGAGLANPKRIEAAAYFVEWIERLIAMCREHGRYPSDKERDEVIDLFRSGQAYYHHLAVE